MIQVGNLEHAMKRGAPIIVEYLGGVASRDAYHMTNVRSDGLGVPSCIQSSLEDAGYCLGATEGLEATVKAITMGWLHPTINQFNPELVVNFDTLANVKQQHEVIVSIYLGNMFYDGVFELWEENSPPINVIGRHA
ncbi:hypothetical protein VNO77_19300 [Canavalia gladiata]|uniref:beta-ketoacyl-[acyl-carrier-protein] synthase I n=1 Tax=Canavalia gladiata TaxID=3824 RepID=A0AAN9QID3_CANGL